MLLILLTQALLIISIYYLPKFNYIEEPLNSKKLDELYNIAKSKNIQLKKKGKNDLINCKKSEIISNILNNVLN